MAHATDRQPNNGVGAAPSNTGPNRGWFIPRRQQVLVLRLFRSRPIATVVRELGLIAALKSPQASQDRRTANGQRTPAGVDHQARWRSPVPTSEVEEMSVATSLSARKRCGLARTCRAWQGAHSTVDGQRAQVAMPPEQRRAPHWRGPRTAVTDSELTTRIQTLLTPANFYGEGHRTVWTRQHLQGVRIAKGRVLRLRRQANLLAPQRVGEPHGPRAHDGISISGRPDVIWGTDVTMTWTTQDEPVCIFLAIDRCAAESAGLHASRRDTRFEALEAIQQAEQAGFGPYNAGRADGVVVRHDTSSVYGSATGESLCRALRPRPQREPALGGIVLDHRSTAAGVDGLQREFHRGLADRPSWQPDSALVRANIAMPQVQAARLLDRQRPRNPARLNWLVEHQFPECNSHGDRVCHFV